MHIPDGYLSPATCAATYAAAIPFWYLALQRIERLLHTRMVPMLALASAFAFVVMMFNLPLPGGTTGHAVGVGIAAVVLGPWAAMVAISTALLIQAVFFGDGGITTFGANSLNMAVVGSVVAYWSYRALAARSALESKRRVVAAGLAGYLAINVSALLTALELGIQPLIAHDTSGAPLYAPYPLSIALPAMMMGHLSFAGLAELLVTGGVVAYLQRSRPELLALCAPAPGTAIAAAPARAAWRPLWWWLAGIMILTPLGLLAGGIAWGEWSAADFADIAVRQQMLQASANVAPPESVPLGLERLSHIWTAPIPDYAPSFLHSAGFGYIMSAVAGTGMILLAFLLMAKIASRSTSSGPGIR